MTVKYLAEIPEELVVLSIERRLLAFLRSEYQAIVFDATDDEKGSEIANAIEAIMDSYGMNELDVITIDRKIYVYKLPV